jgi:hypothetical protein
MKQGIFSEFIGHGIHPPSLFHVEHSGDPVLGLICLLRQMFHVEQFEDEP